MKIVLDANVLISGLFPRSGAPAEIIRRWRDGEVELVVSDRLLAEIGRVLRYPKVASRVNDVEVRELFVELRGTATRAPDVAPHDVRSRDPKDDYLLGLAQSTGAILVTGDKDLLELTEIPVESPRSFLDALTRFAETPGLYRVRSLRRTRPTGRRSARRTTTRA